LLLRGEGSTVAEAAADEVVVVSGFLFELIDVVFFMQIFLFFPTKRNENKASGASLFRGHLDDFYSYY
jgi:hypothetical protein